MKYLLTIILTTLFASKFASAQTFDLMTAGAQNKIAESPFFTIQNNAMSLYSSANFASPFAVVSNDTFVVGLKAATAVGPSASVVPSFSLEQNYPNPFNGTTVIRYAVSEESDVTITVYDITGREIETLVHSNQAAGTYSVGFGKNGLASGTYVYRMVSTARSGAVSVETKKMVAMK